MWGIYTQLMRQQHSHVPKVEGTLWKRGQKDSETQDACFKIVTSVYEGKMHS